jgi:hypothetical protein
MGLDTAWMIRKDGWEIPVVSHIYADKNEIDELLAAAYFLNVNGMNCTRAVRGFLNSWFSQTIALNLPADMVNADDETVKCAVVTAVREYVSAKPYRIFQDKDTELFFAEAVASQAATYWNHGSKPTAVIMEYDVHYDGADIVDILNQLFLRARYGGRYNTVLGCRDMFFRVSSVGFDWFPTIRKFVEERAGITDTVTIVRDLESTGCEKYYTDANSRPYHKMPLSEFLSGNGTTQPIAVKAGAGLAARVMELLEDGGSVQQLRGLRFNYGRIRDYIQRLKYREELSLKEN